MRKQTVYYVTFWSPGAFVAEDWSRDVDSPDPRKVKWPDNAYAFRLFKREDVIDGEQTYKGKPEQLGPTYYHPDSAVQSYDEAQTNPNASRILLDNMRINGWKQIVWTRWGNFPQPFDPKETAILPPPPSL